MRSWEPDHQRKRAVTAIVVDESARLPTHESVDGVLQGQLVRDCTPILEVTLVFGAVELSEASLFEVVVIVVADMEPAFVLGSDAVLETVAGVPRVEVHLADAGRVVSGVGKDLRPRPYAYLVIIAAHRVQIVGDAVADGVHAGQQRGARWDTHRRRGVGAIVSHPLAKNPVDVGCVDECRVLAAQEVGPELVRENEDDVGLPVHALGRPSPRRAMMSRCISDVPAAMVDDTALK